MKYLLKSLIRPLKGRSYCKPCGAWYDPSDPQGSWQHVNCP